MKIIARTALAALTIVVATACFAEDPEPTQTGQTSSPIIKGLSADEQDFVDELDAEEDKKLMVEAFLEGYASIEDGALEVLESAPRRIRDAINALRDRICIGDARACLDCDGGGATTSMMCPDAMCTCPTDSCPDDSLCGGLGLGDVVYP